jgi:hypothetical protein
MASTYSALKIELISTGEQSGTWGTTTNNNLGNDALGEAITGSADVTFASANVTVTLTDTNASQTARNLRLNLIGTTGGARDLILGSGCQIEKLYLINNTCADAITVKNTSGTGIAVPAGKSMFVYNNGTNVVDAITHASSLTLGSALPIASGGTGSTSTTFVNAATNVTGTLPIANGGTGTSSTTFTNLTTNVTGTLPIANGGTGSTSTTFVNAATNVTGTLPIANGGTGSTSTTFVNAATNITGTLPVANGGTGASTLTSANVILGAGTSAVTFVAPGSNGNVLTSNGSTWTSAAAGGGQLQSQMFTAPGTWTKPSSCTQVTVTVIGGGGGGSEGNTLGAGGTGGTSSFGPAVSATGGAGANRPPGGGATPGAPGTSTVSVGTALKSGFAYPAGDQKAFGNIEGFQAQAPGQPGTAYSVSSPAMAGSGSQTAGSGGSGGMAYATVPVSAPVTITVGSGGNGITGPARGGIGGAILVEFVG